MRLARRRYYEKKLENAKSNTHVTWKILNKVLNRKKSRPQLNTIFKSAEGQEISDPVRVANRFCSYFSSIGPNLAKKIQRPPCSHEDFLPGSFRQSIFFSPTTEDDEIITIAQSSASEKAAGYDNIPMSIIEESIQIISELLAHMMNLSIAQGVVPDQARFGPILEK